MAEMFPPNTETPESIILDQEMSDHLHDLLSTMTEEHQEILDMVYLNGFKVGKAAELLGLSGDVARKRLQRAKAALKKRLLQEF
ncbi:MAG: sigma-70 family RNA polymerase sigma factor, partial [Lachnospiraceae bacterium]|nr:sigma-70 family RNA polymerase sigma factor [Lachnospiraceae bacterium]